jgi:hypothetical protein
MNDFWFFIERFPIFTEINPIMGNLFKIRRESGKSEL